MNEELCSIWKEAAIFKIIPGMNDRNHKRSQDGLFPYRESKLEHTEQESRHLSLEKRGECKTILMPLSMYCVSHSQDFLHLVMLFPQCRLSACWVPEEHMERADSWGRWLQMGADWLFTHQLAPSLHTLMDFACLLVAFLHTGLN